LWNARGRFNLKNEICLDIGAVESIFSPPHLADVFYMSSSVACLEVLVACLEVLAGDPPTPAGSAAAAALICGHTCAECVFGSGSPDRWARCHQTQGHAGACICGPHWDRNGTSANGAYSCCALPCAECVARRAVQPATPLGACCQPAGHEGCCLCGPHWDAFIVDSDQVQEFIVDTENLDDDGQPAVARAASSSGHKNKDADKGADKDDADVADADADDKLFMDTDDDDDDKGKDMANAGQQRR
jgi:hypothetical protein